MTTLSTPPRTVVAALSAAVGAAMTTDPDVMVSYHRDRSVLTDSAKPLAVVRPRSIDDVVATLTIAHQHRIPVVTRGAGTGLAGAANAVEGGIVLSLEKMNRILSIDTDARAATVEPGVINGDLAAAVSTHGLWYVPDPGSKAISTIGGNIATNAGGPCCAKYGVTADHVQSIKAVLADGRIITAGSKTRKNVAGLNLMQLLIGSEGTLAVIVEATLRLRAAPSAPSTVVASFPHASGALQAILAVQHADPCLVEIMDRTTITAVNDMTQMGLDTQAGALLLIQCDGAAAAADATTCAQACTDHGASECYSTSDSEEADQLMTARHMALPALERKGTTLLDDLAVPVPRLADMFSAIENISAEHQLTIGTFGHAADGNLHPTIIFDDTNPDERRRALTAFDQLIAACLELGGSLSGEHGIGLLKRLHLRQHISPSEHQLMTGIKTVFDPHNILNPDRAY